MPALNFTYRKTTYRLIYERQLFAGAYMTEDPLLINENLSILSIDPRDMEYPGYFKYLITKFDGASLMSVKGPGIYLQLFLTDMLSLTDFNIMCSHLYRDVSLSQLTTAYIYATLERALATTISLSKTLLLPGWLWMN